MKILMSGLLAGTLFLAAVSISTAEQNSKAELAREIANAARAYIVTQDGDLPGDLSIYRNMDWKSIADKLPVRFDLRDRGVVPPVRDQGNWGTCWGFAAIAASETSILSTLGLTAEEFKKEYGYELNLSERHLAWFGNDHLPLLTEYPDGEYPYIQSQAGEGAWHSDDETNPDEAHYMTGGYMGYASCVFANGMGPELEKDYPYQANDGSSSIESDWSLPEEARYGMAAELKNSAILPCPSMRDEQGNYVYNPAGTEAIKQELLAGRAVSIGYYADVALASQREEEETEGTVSETAMSAGEEAVLRDAAERMGKDYDVYLESRKRQSEAGGGYLNPETSAQYTDNAYTTPTHAVTIVGWDDDYAISNFPADHQPPAPGAWIVRNSWGDDTYDKGYFYLSYYDQSIGIAETFEFVFDDDSTNGVTIYSYDSMEASAVSSAQMEEPVSLANIFSIEDNSVLSDVSVMTTDLNARVMVGVYLLNEGYTSPVDGVLLDTVNADFEFGGYHRIALNHSYQLPAGSVISVVERQKAQTTEGIRYTLPYTLGLSREAAECNAVLAPNPFLNAYSWRVGCVGTGESYVCSGKTWYDWKDIVEAAKAGDSVAALAEFDSLNIKAYLYTEDGVRGAHAFGPEQQYGNYGALICEECGETLIVVK